VLKYMCVELIHHLPAHPVCASPRFASRERPVFLPHLNRLSTLPPRYEPGKPGANPVGYPIMLTKVHLSHFSLYSHYYCDAAYESLRNTVEQIRNAEDLLYIKVAADMFTPPSLFVLTADPIHDTGVVGLHSKGGHNEARSMMLQSCSYNDSFWSTDVVLPPGTTVTQYDDSRYNEQHDRVIER
jgi:hypothetical protein